MDNIETLAIRYMTDEFYDTINLGNIRDNIIFINNKLNGNNREFTVGYQNKGKKINLIKKRIAYAVKINDYLIKHSKNNQESDYGLIKYLKKEGNNLTFKENLSSIIIKSKADAFMIYCLSSFGFLGLDYKNINKIEYGKNINKRLFFEFLLLNILELLKRLIDNPFVEDMYHSKEDYSIEILDSFIKQYNYNVTEYENLFYSILLRYEDTYSNLMSFRGNLIRICDIGDFYNDNITLAYLGTLEKEDIIEILKRLYLLFTNSKDINSKEYFLYYGALEVYEYEFLFKDMPKIMIDYDEIKHLDCFYNIIIETYHFKSFISRKYKYLCDLVEYTYNEGDYKFYYDKIFAIEHIMSINNIVYINDTIQIVIEEIVDSLRTNYGINDDLFIEKTFKSLIQ